MNKVIIEKIKGNLYCGDGHKEWIATLSNGDTVRVYNCDPRKTYARSYPIFPKEQALGLTLKELLEAIEASNSSYSAVNPQVSSYDEIKAKIPTTGSMSQYMTHDEIRSGLVPSTCRRVAVDLVMEHRF